MKDPALTDATGATSDPRLYVQITEQLRQKIISGDLKPGVAVSITDVSRQRGVSRPTVRKAMRALEGDGLLRRYPGLGYYVQPCRQEPPPPHHPEKRRRARGRPAVQRA
jgi:DNA-binding GntR family transcriptional regulator